MWLALLGIALLLLQRRPRGITGESVGEPSNAANDKSLHPELLKRWQQSAAEYARRFADLPQPFLTTTYRSPQRQAQLYAVGRGQPGQPYSVGGYNVIAPTLAEYPRWAVITNARPMESLHNYYPALAFDVAFRDGGGGYSCVDCFTKFAGIAKFFGLEWGGDWQGFKDNPHFQPPGYTWQMALAGKAPFAQEA